MHSSGMRTAHLLTVSLSAREWEGVSTMGGVSQHSFVADTPLPCEQND